THQRDVGVTEVSLDKDAPKRGDLVNVTAVVENLFPQPVAAFNVTIRVGYFAPSDLDPKKLEFHTDKSQDFRVDDLGGHARRALTMNWTAKAGTYIFEAQADT